MITESEYLKALKIVKDYHKQLGHFIDYVGENLDKTPIEVWISNLPTRPSERLRKALLEQNSYSDGKPFKYVEDITRKEFRRIRHVGKTTWKELEELMKL